MTYLVAILVMLAVDSVPGIGFQGPPVGGVDWGEADPTINLTALGISGQGLAARMDAARVHRRLLRLEPDTAVVRGRREARLYAERSPSVVLIVTPNSIGSGSVVDESGAILTSWHVVSDAPWIGVIYKPSVEGQKLEATDARAASVVRIDEVADLALLRVAEPDAECCKPIPFGSMESIAIGADVHAIGHPTGESWTYTRGFISQVRRDYEWVTQAGVKHRASVVQTQTPINPGNSGGPLLDDAGALIGVNAFKADGEGLNFAVSIDDVQALLSRSEDRVAERANASCEPSIVGSSPSTDPVGTLHLLDLDCDGAGDAVLTKPDDPSAPLTLSLDDDGDGQIDTIIADVDRDGGFDVSYYDIDGDGEADLRGYHADGGVLPSRLEPIR